MKKLIMGLLISVLVLGAGTIAFAQTNGNGDGVFGFDEMKPFIEKMHPNFSDEDPREMFDACHGTNGFMQNQGFGMMNNF